MFTGKTPGELGVYGFKHRRGHAMTHPIELVSRLDYQAKPVWEWASRQGSGISRGRCSINLADR